MGILPNTIIHHIPWDMQQSMDPICPLTTISLRRNAAAYPFCHKLTKETNLHLREKMQEACLSLPEFSGGYALEASALSALEKEFLYEHLFPQEWSIQPTEGQHYCIAADHTLFATIAAQEHLHIQWTDYKGEWSKGWPRISALDSRIEALVPYAFSPRFGYVTTKPEYAGTGLTILCYLHLPCLIANQKLSSLLAPYLEEVIEASSFSGLLTDIVGDFLVLKNKRCLGITEEQIFQTMTVVVQKLKQEEEQERALIKNRQEPEWQDKIAKAWGLFSQARLLQTKEAIQAASAIKLGLYLGWIQGITDAQWNSLLFQSRRAHISMRNQLLPTDKTVLAQARAKHFQSKLLSGQLYFPEAK